MLVEDEQNLRNFMRQDPGLGGPQARRRQLPISVPTVRYTESGGAKVAQRIEQASSTFTGTVEAIDADARTIKAQHLFSEKEFNLAKDCPILFDGKSEGKLSDLRIGDKLSVQYEDIDGVLVATRIARDASPPRPAPPAQVTRTEPSEP